MERKTSQSYQKEVLEQYHRDKGGELSTYLLNPTPRLIKQACILLLSRATSTNDSNILNCFFQFKDEESRLKEIKSFDNDRFKPVVNFLKGKTNKTSEENIELISWLIDFQPRPCQEYLKFVDPLPEGEALEKTKSEINDENDFNGFETDNDAIRVDQEEQRKKREEEIRKLFIAISIAFVAILTMVFVFRNQIFPSGGDIPPNNETTKNPTILGIDNELINKNCMTWADSVYVTASCDKGPFSIYGTKVVPLDRVKLKSMRKVEVDVAYEFFIEGDTKKPLIWYYKTKEGEIEYFTAPGLHPVNDETLRKITKGIIEKYVPIHTNREDSFVQ